MPNVFRVHTPQKDEGTLFLPNTTLHKSERIFMPTFALEVRQGLEKGSWHVSPFATLWPPRLCSEEPSQAPAAPLSNPPQLEPGVSYPSWELCRRCHAARVI